MTDKKLPVPATPLSRAQRAAILNLVRRTAKNEILPRFQRLAPGDTTTKTDADDLVTEADKAAEKMLTRGLNMHFPGVPVIGEEAVAADPALRDQIAEAELAFILDPIDGTWNYVQGLPLFGMILSATRFGRPIFGLLYDPVSDDWIMAGEDSAAEREGVRFRRRAIHASAAKEDDTLSGFVHLNLLPEGKTAQMAALYPRFRRVGSLQCSCHEYRLLAQGASDFHISGTLNPWDHAAGVLIVQRAGGVARMLNGDAYNTAAKTGYLLVAPNEPIWQYLQKEFAFLEDS
ncbi:MAG: inositol monophosphatase [Pseudomonadota bacterium]